MGLPYAAHSRLLPLLSNTLPIFNEICRRSAKFILSCLCSGPALVRTVANYGIHARSNSFIGRNVMFYVIVFISQQLISNLARLPI